MLEKSLPYKGFSLVIFSVHVVGLLRMSDTCDNSRKEGKGMKLHDRAWNNLPNGHNIDQ